LNPAHRLTGIANIIGGGWRTDQQDRREDSKETGFNASHDNFLPDNTHPVETVLWNPDNHNHGSGAARNSWRPSRIGVYFLGGVHARESGSCDILVTFIERIEQSYLNGTALAFGGGRTFSAAEIKTIVFPQANPDG
jgi:hypothetical protein